MRLMRKYHTAVAEDVFSFYTNSLNRLIIAQNGSINAFGNTITSTGGFIGNASTATKLQTARTITIGGQSLSFDGTQNLTYSLSGIGIPVGTTSQYLRGDLSLATFPTIHTGSGFNGGVTFWNGANSLFAATELTWNNTSKNLTITGGLIVNSVSSNSMSTNVLSTQSFKLGSYVTAGYVLTADVNGNGTWKAPTYTLPTASSSVLGGVKVGYGLYVNVDTGSLAVDTMYFVPYTGAASDVNLGSRSIFAYDFVLYSDINLKCNIESIPKHRIDIDYKQFEYKTNEGEKRYGVIAQELLSIAPEFVVKNGDYYAVKYTDLLVYEIVQLKEEIKELKSMLCR